MLLPIATSSVVFFAGTSIAGELRGAWSSAVAFLLSGVSITLALIIPSNSILEGMRQELALEVVEKEQSLNQLAIRSSETTLAI